MTIRKVGTTEEPTGIIRTKGKYFDYTDYYSDLWTKAWEKVGDSFDIPKRSS